MMKEEMALSGSRGRLELFVRSSVPAGVRERQADTAERLRALNDAARIEAVTVRTWEKRILVGEDRHEECEIHRAYTAFAEWARERGVELDDALAALEKDDRDQSRSMRVSANAH
ncbi:hypothetical protein BRC81_04935 [Halobacteriales archaeon QS_1_68_20]|nr:MAG: hypothetical protein BRC81_04935 [Halobacteriales archaeon QS_1_68_20]